jgi:hypothetical protein
VSPHSRLKPAYSRNLACACSCCRCCRAMQNCSRRCRQLQAAAGRVGGEPQQ